MRHFKFLLLIAFLLSLQTEAAEIDGINVTGEVAFDYTFLSSKDMPIPFTEGASNETYRLNGALLRLKKEDEKILFLGRLNYAPRRYSPDGVSTTTANFGILSQLEGLKQLDFSRDHGFRRKISTAIQRFSNSKMGQLSQLPFLPRVKSSPVELSTLTEWVYGGYEKHKFEIDTFMNRQAKVETYQNVRSLWGKFVLGVIAYYAIQEFINYDTDEKEAQLKARLSQEISDKIVADLPDADKMLVGYAESNYKFMVQTYEDTYGEPPTNSEKIEMKQIAYKEYRISYHNDES